MSAEAPNIPDPSQQAAEQIPPLGQQYREDDTVELPPYTHGAAQADSSPIGDVYIGGTEVGENLLVNQTTGETVNPDLAASYRTKDPEDKSTEIPFATRPIPETVRRRNTRSVHGRQPNAKDKLVSLGDSKLIKLSAETARLHFPSEQDYRKFVAARDKAAKRQGWTDYAKELTAEHKQAQNNQRKEVRKQVRQERVEKAARAISRFGRAMGLLPPRPDIDLAGLYENRNPGDWLVPPPAEQTQTKLRQHVSHQAGAIAMDSLAMERHGAPGVGEVPPEPLSVAEQEAFERLLEASGNAER